jgi:hypothetical protein
MASLFSRNTLETWLKAPPQGIGRLLFKVGDDEEAAIIFFQAKPFNVIGGGKSMLMFAHPSEPGHPYRVAATLPKGMNTYCHAFVLAMQICGVKDDIADACTMQLIL